MKLLLISLQSNAYITGLKYVAASARAHGYDVKILFIPGYLEADLDPAIEEFVRDFQPDLAGISLMSIEFYPAKNLTRLLKEKFNMPVIWGGVHAIIKTEECIKYADYVCAGEGERAIVSLLEHLGAERQDAPPEIPGVWVNRSGDITRPQLAQPEMDLDSLPFPGYLPDYFFGFHNKKIYSFAQNERLFRQYALYGGTAGNQLAF